jgi:hypothetical protein
MAARPVRWHACAAPGCRYVLSVGPLCAEHLRVACGVALAPAAPTLPHAHAAHEVGGHECFR